MATPYRRSQGKWLLLIGLAISSLMFTGCEKGTLGMKESAIEGYVLDAAKNTPVADALIHAVAGDGTRKDATTGGDGHYVFSGLPQGNDSQGLEWVVSAEKFGYSVSYPNGDATGFRVRAGYGNTVTAPLINMTKGVQLTKGMMRGYPVDSVTGSPLTNFKVTISYNAPTASRYKVFESADDFKNNGWTGLDGGTATVMITSDNYTDWQSAPLTQAAGGGTTGPQVTISNVPYDLGVIRMNPLTVNINGTLRNLPGYVMGTGGQGGATTFAQDTRIWAEAAGKVVATGTAQAIEGNAIYNIANVPITAGAVAVKCKIRGYDLLTINPSVTIPKQRPSGTIAGVDANFANIDPIKRDVRVVVVSTTPTQDNLRGTYYEGERARIFIRQGGRDMVPYVDVTAVNYRAEAYFSGVVTGYPLDFLANNLARGYVTGTQNAVTIPEDGGTIFTVQIVLGSGGN